MKVLCFSENGFILPQFRDGACKDVGDVLIPLTEFISRLKGEWVEGKTVTLTHKLMAELIYLLQDETEKQDGNKYAAKILSTIKEQLNNQ